VNERERESEREGGRERKRNESEIACACCSVLHFEPTLHAGCGFLEATPHAGCGFLAPSIVSFLRLSSCAHGACQLCVLRSNQRTPVCVLPVLQGGLQGVLQGVLQWVQNSVL